MKTKTQTNGTTKQGNKLTSPKAILDAMNMKKQADKEAKILEKAERKENIEQKKVLAEQITQSWLNDTQSKTALENWIKTNENKVLPYLNKINVLNGTKITFAQVNKQLFKFAHKHELNKLNLDAEILEVKQFFNIKLMISGNNSLLNRFAKYTTNTNEKFVKYSENATEKHLQGKYEAKIKMFILSEIGKKQTFATIDKLVKENKTRQQIVNELNKILADLQNG